MLEAEARFGTGASARNSEVIHAGIYYPRDSLKARLCVAGRERLYEFCRKHGVAHRRCGKLIVASSAAQLPALEGIAAAARANGVDLIALSGAEARRIEPQLACEAALHSPLTGIIDAQALMLALLAEAEAHGATLATRSAVTRVVLDAAGRGDRYQWVRACGARAHSHQLRGPERPGARATHGRPAPRAVPRAYFAKGHYFSLSARAPFRT